MSSEKKAILIDLFEAQIKELNRIAEFTGRTRADLLREAVTMLISTYTKALEENATKMDKAVDRGVVGWDSAVSTK